MQIRPAPKSSHREAVAASNARRIAKSEAARIKAGHPLRKQLTARQARKRDLDRAGLGIIAGVALALAGLFLGAYEADKANGIASPWSHAMESF